MSFRIVLHKLAALASYTLRLSKPLPLSMPVHYHIEATSRCNLRCRFCPYREIDMSSDWHGDMEPSLFRHLLSQIKIYPPAHGVSLHLGGEPLLHPRIDILVKEVHNILGITPMMATNGTMLTANIAQNLSRAGGAHLIIDFSADRTEFERLRTGASWEKVRYNIITALTLDECSNLKIFIRSLDEDMSRLQNILGKYDNLYFTKFQLHNVGGEFAHKIESEFNMKISRKKYFVCTHPWFGMAITWDGKVVICCRDILRSHIVGDLKITSIRDVWLGEKMQNARKLLVSRKIENLPLCKTCSRPWDKRNSITELIRKYGLKSSD